MSNEFSAELMAFHHSRLLQYRNPQGAVCTGETITLSLDVGNRFTDSVVSLRLWLHDHEVFFPMERTAKPWGARWSISLKMPLKTGLIWYFFRIALPEETLYYGADSAQGALYPHEPPGYQITVYEQGFTTPRWYREGIIYQIFPDRFYRTGDPEAGLAYHRAMGRRVRYHESWTEAPEYLPEPGEEHFEPNDFFGGTLDGITEQLPYLARLGVSCIYLNPIFESASNHRYDTANYRAIDPILGDAQALERLCEQARARGMHIMLDGVFSHTGDDSLYFNKYSRYPDSLGAWESTASPYREWYTFGDYPPMGYRSWWGFPRLPEVNELDPAYQDFVYGADDCLIAHWAQHGVTSWRLDVADELPDAFIARLRTRQKELDVDSVLLGEVWEDASVKEAYGVRREYVYGNELDSVMNYPFRDAVADFLLGHIDAYACNDRLQILRERYPKPFWYACMNLLSTHDSVRAITLLGDAPSRHALSREQQAVYALSQEQEQLGKARFILATALQMALPGVPSIYYGDEAGMAGMADPFNRATYPWGQEDKALLAAVSLLAKTRHTSDALRAGFCLMGALSQNVFAVLRQTGETDAFGNPAVPSRAALVINRGQTRETVTLRTDLLPEGADSAQFLPLHGRWRDVLTGEEHTAQDGALVLSVAPITAMLLTRSE